MTSPRPSSQERRQRILHTASRLFAERGYAGASLRDIAREAGCSLTLLDHHFGDKAHLLQAVVKEQESLCRERLAGLQAILVRPVRFVVDDFIEAWVHYEFDLYETREGRRYLRLMLRLQADRETGDDLRKTLNCSESTVARGLESAWPGLAPEARSQAWRLASSALYAAVVGMDDVPQEQRPQEVALAKRRTIAFVLHGLKAFGACAAGPGDAAPASELRPSTPVASA